MEETTVSLSLSHTHTHTHTRARTHTRAHTHTHTHTHSRSHRGRFMLKDQLPFFFDPLPLLYLFLVCLLRTELEYLTN